MLEQRAKEIITSPFNIEVLHNGKCVWITAINNQSAEVAYCGGNEKFAVPLSELEETGLVG